MNTALPAYSLPGDVLHVIFEHAMNIIGPAKGHGTPAESLGWMVLTHFCRYWRTYALQTPILWTSIPLDLGPAPTRAFLARSCDAPLCMEQHPDIDNRPVDPHLLHEIISLHADRTKSLKLILDDPVVGVLAQLLPTMHFPLLEDLVFVKTRAAQPSLEVHFPIDHPRLVGLGMSHLFSTPPPSILKSIAVLHLDLTGETLHPSRQRGARGYQRANPPEWTEYRRLLLSCESLRALTLVDALPEAPPPSQPPLGSIELPQLQTLSIDHFHYDQQCGTFLRLLRAPSLSRFTFNTSEMIVADYGEEDSEAILPLIPLQLWDPLSLSLHRSEKDRDIIYLEGDSERLDMRRHFQLYFTLGWRGPYARTLANERTTELVMRVLAYIPLMRVQRLTMDLSELTGSITDWGNVLCEAKEISHLEVLIGADYSLIAALGRSTSDPGSWPSSRGGDLLLPSLQHLHVYEIKAKVAAVLPLENRLEIAMEARTPLNAVPSDVQLHTCRDRTEFAGVVKAGLNVSGEE